MIWILSTCVSQVSVETVNMQLHSHPVGSDNMVYVMVCHSLSQEEQCLGVEGASHIWALQIQSPWEAGMLPDVGKLERQIQGQNMSHFKKINFLPCTKNVFQLCHCTSVIVIHVTVAQKTLLYLIALPCQNMCIRPTELTATRMQYVAALSCYVKDFTFRHHKKIPWKAIHINQLAFKSLFNMWMRTYVNMPHCKDLDSEIAALGYTMRKLWSGLRALWRNSPDTSSSDVIQALKNEMLKKPGPGPCQTAEDTSVLQTVNDLWSLEGDKTGWSGGNTKEDHSHQHK